MVRRFLYKAAPRQQQGMASFSELYRSHLHGEAEKETVWRHGAPPRYDLVNKVFESGRTQEWPKGSLEEIVQNLVKTWEMELSHKTQLRDFKSIDFDKFSFSVNGGSPMSAGELLNAGSYNALLASVEHPFYKASSHTFQSSHKVFMEAFPGGFAWEVLQVYSGPPIVACKWRHWGTNAKTNQTVEMIGMAVAEVNEQLKIEKLEVYYDPAQFLEKLFGPRKDLTV